MHVTFFNTPYNVLIAHVTLQTFDLSISDWINLCVLNIFFFFFFNKLLFCTNCNRIILKNSNETRSGTMDSFSRYNESLCDNKKPIIKTLHRDHSFILTILILRTILKMNVKIAEINPIIKTWISPYQPYQNRLVPYTAIHWSNIYIWSI